jgi:hypothetical protein
MHPNEAAILHSPSSVGPLAFESTATNKQHPQRDADRAKNRSHRADWMLVAGVVSNLFDACAIIDLGERRLLGRKDAALSGVLADAVIAQHVRVNFSVQIDGAFHHCASWTNAAAVDLWLRYQASQAPRFAFQRIRTEWAARARQSGKCFAIHAETLRIL